MEFRVKQENNFEYVEEGEGQVILLLHGLFGALSNFRDVLSYFSKHYKVVIPIMPIYKMPMIKATVGELSNFIHRFMEFKQYQQVNVLGNSLGGHVALIYTLQHSSRVSSMILTGSSGLYESSMGGTFPKRNNYEFIKEKVEFTFYSPGTASKELVDEVFGIVNDRTRAMKIIAMAKSAIRHNLRKEITKINVPSCLIWGYNDQITPPEAAEEFNDLLPNSELHFIDKCGHAPMMERPDEFNQILEQFLSKVLIHSGDQL
ncbi:MAG: alpha/beta hydrolase [Bacteroidia bacterium]